MNFEQALVHELSSISGLSGKVYPGEAPEKVIPYIVYLSSAGLKDKDLDGYKDSRRVPLELNIVATRYSDMKQFTESTIEKLISFERRVIGVDGPFISELTYEPPAELFEDAIKAFRSVIDVVVYY
ncbi:hypothetical protein [Paenibacillus sp. FSL R7-0331]|uniref:hypothetical protein n=1 Tax=Paenibacillus sp. FSL R7-0331 TaxID=1536773 RepID=UPI0004F630C9|nr:hypothetical protein [Paenibacillus sp. FSL R7-0331]AIQ54568.1 hypothetical protein R70331_25695 [Paenibacillus sp. FSL R7-0331]